VLRLINQLRSTLIATTAAVVVLPAHGINWIELKLNPLFDHVTPAALSGCVLILVGVAMDWARAWRRKRYERDIETQKLQALQATMRTVQHVVNTFLNDLLLFEVQAAGVIPREMLDSLDDTVQQIARQLKAIGDVESVREKPLGGGVGIDYVKPDDVPRTSYLSNPDRRPPGPPGR
jgi:hypothetical protein